MESVDPIVDELEVENMKIEEYKYFDVFKDYIWYLYTRKIRAPFRVLFKYPYQRLVRGFDDRALWSLDDYIVDHVERLLWHFYLNNDNSYPSAMTASEWGEKVRNLHRSWEALKLLKENEFVFNPITEEGIKDESALYEKYKRQAFDNLYEVFEDLWD